MPENGIEEEIKEGALGDCYSQETPRAAPLPPTITVTAGEAENSCNLRFQMPQGFTVQWTMRSSDSDLLMDQLLGFVECIASMGFKPAEGGMFLQPNQSSVPAKLADKSGPGWCEIHQVEMKHYEKGQRNWYAHALDDGSGDWCNPQSRK